MSATTKITKAQAQALVERDGSVYKGVRRALEEYLADITLLPQPTSAPAPELPAQQAPQEPEPTQATTSLSPGRHWHKRVRGAISHYHQGQPQYHWTCGDDGCDWTEVG